MPWANPDEGNNASWQAVSIGPVMLAIPTFAANNQFPATLIATTGAWDSGVLNGDGFKVLSVGVTTSGAGAITIQRYVDSAGLVAQGAVSTIALVGATPAVLNVTDGLPYASFRIRVTNTAGSTATLTNFAVLMAAA